jgi:integrase
LWALIVVLWRGGLRIQEALALIESDLDPRRGSILVRKGKGNGRREVGLDAWAWSDHINPLARVPRRAAARRAFLRDRRTNTWAAVVSNRCARRASPLRARCEREAQV